MTVLGSLSGIIGSSMCYARGCTAKRERGRIMCTPHWQLLIPTMQRRVIRSVGAYLKEPGNINHQIEVRDAIVAAKVNVEYEQGLRDSKQPTKKP